MSLLFFALLAPATLDAVARFQCTTTRPLAALGEQEISEAYAARTIAILSSALSRNQARLVDLVLPDATFSTSRGDTITGPRSSGPAAAIEFATSISPLGYEIRTPFAGPISTDPCGSVAIDVLLIDKNDEEAQQLTFRFRQGMLAKVDGMAVSLDRGIFTKAE